MATPAQTFLLRCSVCDGKMTNTGQVVGGKPECPHTYVPLAVKPSVVYPSPKESAIIRRVDRNREETLNHVKQFEQDAGELSSNLTKARQHIGEVIAQLQDKLTQRKAELEHELTSAFEERDEQIHSTIQSLTQHAGANQTIKDKSQDALVNSNDSVTERELAILAQCQCILEATPSVKFVDAQLHCTFDSLSILESKISKLGKLHFLGVNSGKPCTFPSVARAAPVSPPPADLKAAALHVTLPEIDLRTAMYLADQDKIRIAFRVKPGKQPESVPDDFDVLASLYVDVHCVDDDDDEKRQALYEHSIPFQQCTLQKGKYMAFIEHAFEAGKTIGVKIRGTFVSPDDDKYVNCEGEWSQEQTCFITEQSNKVADAVAPPAVPGGSGGSKSVGKERVVASVDEEGYSEKRIVAEKPPVKPVAGKQSKRSASKKDVVIDENAPKQIATIAFFKESRKRVVLRFSANKGTYDYTTDILRHKLLTKFKPSNLHEPFSLKTDRNQEIEEDQDIVKYLTRKDAKLYVSQGEASNV